MPGLVERLLQIDGRSEAQRVVALSGFAFLTAGAYVSCRTVADALFLANVGARHLPTIHLIATGVVAGLTVISIRWRNRPRGLLPAQLSLAAATLAFPLFTTSPVGPVASGMLYVLAQLHGTVGMISLTLLLDRQFDGDQPSRVFGIVGAGATLAALVFGGVAALSAGVLRPLQLLYVVAALDLVAVVPVRWLSAGAAGPSSGHAVFQADTNSDGVLTTRQPLRLARWLLLLTAVKVAALTVVEFQWKVAVAEAHAGEEAAMEQYFGWYYAGVSMLTGTVQLFLTGRLLQRIGAASALLLLPSSLLCGSALILAMSGSQIRLWAATALKGAESLRRGVNDPALQLLFKALPARQRQSVVTRMHGIAKPLAEFAAALALQFTVLALGPRDLSWVLLALIGGWLYLVSRVRSAVQCGDCRGGAS